MFCFFYLPQHVDQGDSVDIWRDGPFRPCVLVATWAMRWSALWRERLRCVRMKHLPPPSSRVAQPLFVFSLCLVKVTDGLSELKDVDRASVYEAGKDLAGAAVKILARGLTLPYREVGAAAVVFRFLLVVAEPCVAFAVGYAIHAPCAERDCSPIPLLIIVRRIPQGT